ncbi:MAG: HYR domain-containing protein [Candidatus Acidiferrales bacterium]
MSRMFRFGFRWTLKVVLFFVATVSPVSANQPPRAVAAATILPDGSGPSAVSRLVGPGPGETVPHTVFGSGSFDPDGDPLAYRWDCDNRLILVGIATNQPDLSLQLPAGTYNFTLTVADTSGTTSSDTAQVKVLVDNIPPDVTPPEGTTVSSTESGGVRAANSADLNKFLFQDAFATDPLNLQFSFTQLPPQVNGADVNSSTLFPIGTTTVTFRFQDAFGNVGSAAADVYVTDLQHGDIFVGAGRVISPFGQTAGQVMLIRGGQAQLFCKGTDSQTDPRFFFQNVEVLADSLGRAVFLAAMPSTNSNLPHYGLFRCDFPGDTPRMLGVYEGSGSRPAGDPVQFPGDKFGQVGGLHLSRTRAIVIQNNTAQVLNEDSYVFAAKRANGTSPFAHISLKSVRYRSLGGFSEDGPEPEQSHNSGSGFVPDMTNYKGDTYSGGRSNKLRRQSDPLVIHASGSAFNTQFNATLHLFGGIREIDGTLLAQGFTTIFFDPLNIPNALTGCGSPPPPGVSTATPASAGSYYSFGSGDEIIVSPDFGLLTTYNGLGLCGTVMTATCPWSSYLANVDQYLIDDDPSNDSSNRFLHDNCSVRQSVPVRPVMPGTNPANNLPNDPSKLVVGPQGLLGTQFRTGRVFRVPDSPTGLEDLVSMPVPAAWGIAAFPPQNVAPSGLVIVIQINSPVDVLATDAGGRRLGVDPSGTAVNDFAEKAHDTGAASHPRFFVIRDAQPGAFSVQSIGTGVGPFEIHIFALNLDRTRGNHLVSSGTASPGATATHDFTLDPNGTISFNNTPPFADAGADQTVTTDASGNGTVMLDGSASSDPDGDALSFTWGGPFGALAGASITPTLPAGAHVLTLTVDDGKGGTAKDTVLVTVNGSTDTTPPILTLPGSLTIPAMNSAGAAVNYTALANDAVSAPLTPICVPASGAIFPMGTTTVNCSASDAAGNTANGSFTVTVIVGVPRINGVIAGKGRDANGNFYVDLRLSNTGSGHARSVQLARLTFRTLSGTGTVSYNSALSMALPAAVGALDAGASTTVRLFLHVPGTVTRFSISEGGTLDDVTGTTFSFAAGQMVIP